MKIIKPYWTILNEPNWDNVLLNLEGAIRTCYKSEHKITKGSAEAIIRNIIARGHESTLEHQSMSVRFVCDRGFSHEICRHRHCSFSQESTRYVNYGGNDIQFILPSWMDDKYLSITNPDLQGESQQEQSPESAEQGWLMACFDAESYYHALLARGWKPEQAALLRIYPRRFLCYDPDKPGQDKMKKLAEWLSVLPGETLVIEGLPSDPGSLKKADIQYLGKEAGLS